MLLPFNPLTLPLGHSGCALNQQQYFLPQNSFKPLTQEHFQIQNPLDQLLKSGYFLLPTLG
jgi:hypothetical protein